MFHALVHGQVHVPGVTFDVQMDDIETLNRRALGESSAPSLAISKISASALGFVADRYALLRTGAALGRGVGPLVVARAGGAIQTLSDLSGLHVAVPGLRTTAYLLLSLYAPPGIRFTPVRFDQIMPRVAAEEFDAGLVIHESRFTYQEHGLTCIADVGQLWEADTELPLPLGVIVAKRELGAARLRVLEEAVGDSVKYGFAHRDESAAYIRAHAQEMSAAVCAKHIELYVNPYSIDVGDQGQKAVETLLARGARIGLLPTLRERLWL